MEIDLHKLTAMTGAEVYPVVAVQGSGVRELFEAAIRVAKAVFNPVMPTYDRDVEECIAEISRHYPAKLKNTLNLDERFVIIRLLEMDEEFESITGNADPVFLDFVILKRRQLAEYVLAEAGVFESHRHAYVFDLFEQVARVRHKHVKDLRDRIHHFIINPIPVVLSPLSACYPSCSLFRSNWVISSQVSSRSRWVRWGIGFQE